MTVGRPAGGGPPPARAGRPPLHCPPAGATLDREVGAGQLARPLLVRGLSIGGEGLGFLTPPYHVVQGARLGTEITGTAVEGVIHGAKRIFLKSAKGSSLGSR